MKKLLLIIFFGFFLSVPTLSAQSGTFTYEQVTTRGECKRINGEWFRKKCWIKFSDFGIRESRLDQVLSEEYVNIVKAKVELDGVVFPMESFPLGFTLIYSQGKTIIISSNFDLKKRTLYIVVDSNTMKNQALYKMKAQASLWDGDIIHKPDRIVDKLAEGSVEIVLDREKYMFSGMGNLVYLDKERRDQEIKERGLKPLNNKNPASKNSTNSLVESRYLLPVKFLINESIFKAGSTQLKVRGRKIILNGEIGTRTYFQIDNAIKDNPKVDTLVLETIPGSVNEEINVHIGRLIRKHRLTTELVLSSRVATGGLYLFVAGFKRIWNQGAKLGINTWCCINGKEASDVPVDHPRHNYYSEYLVKMLGPKLGNEFYSFILKNADSRNIIELGKKEIDRFKLATYKVKN